MNAIFRCTAFAVILVTPVSLVALGCGRVADSQVTEAPEASASDASPWPLGDEARADRRVPPREELLSGSCEPPDDAGKPVLCDFGFACVYTREDAAPDAAPEPGCGSRADAEACGGFWCGRGCRCKDAVARVCACE